MGSTYVVSDVHGHLDDLREVLLGAHLIDADDRWAGGDADLWVLGDLVDRGPDGIGVVRFVRSLQDHAPDHVRVLLGNHEALMLGYHLFPDTRFADVWSMNGGHEKDQEGLTDDDVVWLRALPAMARAGDHLLVHSDTTDYLTWGDSVDAINATVADVLAGDDAQAHFDAFAALTSRFDFKGVDGPQAARTMLDTLGGKHIVHGHSIIGTIVDAPSEHITGPLTYADGLAVAIDGGRYDGGPLLLVELT
ncbi:MAG: metallophosphoesterase family protein [Nocardioidaceae bacterium]